MKINVEQLRINLAGRNIFGEFELYASKVFFRKMSMKHSIIGHNTVYWGKPVADTASGTF
jgi:hypothetical protein